MLFLLGAVGCTSLLNIVPALSSRRGWDGRAVLGWNYLASAAAAGLLAALVRPALYFPAPGLLAGALSGGMTGPSSMSFAVWFGLFTGVLYLLCLRAVEKSVREKGAGVTTLYQRLGILVPILCSALLWGEVPSPVQLAGLAASVAVMAALETVPTGVAYPVLSVGSVAAVTAVDVLAFHRALSRREKLALGLAALCLVLVNL